MSHHLRAASVLASLLGVFLLPGAARSVDLIPVPFQMPTVELEAVENQLVGPTIGGPVVGSGSASVSWMLPNGQGSGTASVSIVGEPSSSSRAATCPHQGSTPPSH